jgi:DNA-binding Lrp family transcriptional regulator
MEFLVDQFKFLGLNDREIKVFTTLATFGRMNMTKISSRSGLSRTTVDAIVRRLVVQGLVTQERVGGHQEYSVKLKELAERLDWIEKRLHPESLVKGTDASSVCLPSTGIEQEMCGHEGIHTVVAETFVQHARERVVMLLSTMAVTEERMRRFEHCVGFARHAEVKLEILTTTDVANSLSVYAKEILALLSVYDLKLHFLPPSFCFEHVDVVAFRDTVLLINQRADTVEQATSVHTVLAFNHLLRVAREVGWSMDMKMWVEGLIASQK